MAVNILDCDNIEVDGLFHLWVENPHHLVRSTEWPLDPGVDSRLFDLWGIPVTYSRSLCHQAEQQGGGVLFSPLGPPRFAGQPPWRWIGLWAPVRAPHPTPKHSCPPWSASYSHLSVVASKRVVSPDSAAPCWPTSVAARGRWSFPQSRWGPSPQSARTLPSHLETWTISPQVRRSVAGCIYHLSKS